MGNWDEKYRQHGVFQSLVNFGIQVDECFSVSDEPLATESLLRLKSVLAFVGKRLETADPLFVPNHPLNVILEAFNSAYSQLNDFKSNASIGHLDTANTNLDEAIRVLSEIPCVVTSDDIGVINAAASQYRDELARLAESARSEIYDLEEHANVTQARMDVTTGEVQRKASDVQSELTELKQRIDSMVFSFQHDYSEAQATRQKDYDSLMAKFGNQFSTLEDIHRNDFDTLSTQLKNKSAETVTFIDERKAESERLVGIIGNLSLTAGFQNAAKSALDDAKKWQSVTVGAIIALATVIGLSLFFASGATNDWPTLAGRVLISLAFAALAKYAGTQADRNFQIYRMNSKLELELQALGPYLAPLQVDEQHKFRIALANKVFGQDDTSLIKSGWNSPTNIIDILTSEDARATLKEIAPLFVAAAPDLAKAWTESVKATRSRRWFGW